MDTAAQTMAMGAAAGGTTHAGGDRGTGTEAQRGAVDTTVIGTELSCDSTKRRRRRGRRRIMTVDCADEHRQR
jgi:hypothetical protein